MLMENYFAEVEEAAEWVKHHASIKPRIAVVLSAGLGRLVDDISDAKIISSADIPHFPTSKAEGHSGKLYFGTLAGVKLVALSGRYHYYEGHSPQSVVFPHFVLAKLGVKILITTNAAGGVNQSFKPGDIMMIDDHINMMGINPLIGIATQRKHDQFTNMTTAYDPALRKLATEVAGELKVEIKNGVYLATSGPSYETKAEVRSYRQMGADAVGMSTVPEIIAANFLGLRCLGFSCIANPASDIHEGEMSHSEVLTAMHAMAPRMISLLSGVIEKIGKTMS